MNKTAKELLEAWHAANWDKTPAEGDEMAGRFRKLDEFIDGEVVRWGEHVNRVISLDTVSRILDGEE